MGLPVTAAEVGTEARRSWSRLNPALKAVCRVQVGMFEVSTSCRRPVRALACCQRAIPHSESGSSTVGRRQTIPARFAPSHRRRPYFQAGHASSILAVRSPALQTRCATLPRGRRYRGSRAACSKWPWMAAWFSREVPRLSRRAGALWRGQAGLVEPTAQCPTPVARDAGAA
jgi:hypothetical protein